MASIRQPDIIIDGTVNEGITVIVFSAKDISIIGDGGAIPSARMY